MQMASDDGEDDVFADFDFSQAGKAGQPAHVTLPVFESIVASDAKIQVETEEQNDQELILLYEAKSHQLENKLLAISSSFESLKSEKQKWDAGRTEQTAKIAGLEKQVAKLKEDLINAKSEKHVDNTLSLQWSREKEELEHALQAKDIEISALSADLDQKSETLHLFKQELGQEKEKISAMEAIESSNRALISSQEIEVTQLTKMTDWLNQELSSKSSQLLEYRKDKSTQLNRLQSDLENIAQEKAGLESRAQLLQKRCGDLELKLEAKMDQLRESENRQISCEQVFLIFKHSNLLMKWLLKKN